MAVADDEMTFGVSEGGVGVIVTFDSEGPRLILSTFSSLIFDQI